ncbi:MAG: dTDP-glucose 4,6-dehydratase [Parcubacteria group bacterium Gr01-1014_106]|nr:MAG: dTDP-glucose 4,6-dehydratase [Parcubacteria group bacterium Gr01-1014_106]
MPTPIFSAIVLRDMNVLVTGGAGFIGSAFARLLVRERSDVRVVVFDTLTYAGNRANLKPIDGSHVFIHADIADAEAVRTALKEHAIDAIVNFAAESHVDRSIMSGTEFIDTDVYGTYILLTEARAAGVQRYVQVSTDEVYGSLSAGAATEEYPLKPNNPYSASKAGGDLQVRAAFQTYGFPTLITRGSNTYGPYQYPEKLVPLFITNILEGKKVPLYGDGKNRRDWLYVDDHARGILTVLEKGVAGEIYNLGSTEELENIALTRRILTELGKGEEWIEPVADRLGHDRRYALDSSKAQALGWTPSVPLEKGLKTTIAWYQEHRAWWEPLKSGAYRAYYRQQYERRQSVAGNTQ